MFGIGCTRLGSDERNRCFAWEIAVLRAKLLFSVRNCCFCVRNCCFRPKLLFWPGRLIHR